MNEFKVGLMAIATMVAVAFMSFKITQNQSGFGDYVAYQTKVKDASGIFPKTPIKVAGINAGRIKLIELQGNEAVITFEVLSSVHIMKGSKLRIKSVGFLGDKFLDIFMDETSKEALPPMSMMETATGEGLEDLTKNANQLLGDVKDVVKEIKGALEPINGKPALRKIVEDIDQITENTKSVTESLKRTVTKNEGKFDGIMEDLKEVSSSLRHNLDKNAPDSVMADVKIILENSKQITGDLGVLVADIRKGKGTMGKLFVQEDIADEVRNTLSGVQKLVNKVDNIRTEVSAYTGVTSDGTGSTDAGIRIYPSPERFYSLGIVTSAFGPESEKHESTTTNGQTTTVIRKEKQKDTYRFNAQIGRRINNWGFRGGLIESSGGLGLDYDIRKINTRASVEAFDYSKASGANIRLSSEIQIWNVLFGKATVENLTRSNKIGTISAGIKFNDEDLKGLLGFFAF